MSRIPHSLWSDRKILSTLSDLVAHDRVSTVEILRLIGEVERRQLFVPLGFTSTFDFCTRHLKLASSSAMRRIEVARVIRRFPETAVLLESGDVNLSTVSLVADVLTEENHQELLEQIRGKSQREVEGIVSLHKPPVKLKDRVRPVFVAVEMADRSAVGLPQQTTEDTGIAAIEQEAASTSAPAGDSEAPILGQTSQNPRNSLILHCRCGSKPTAGGAGGLTRPSTQTPATAATLRGAATPTFHSPPTRTSHPAPTRTILHRKFQIQFLAGPAFMKKFERARALLSNRLDDPSFEKIFEAMMDEFLERHSPESRIARREERRAKRAPAGNAKKATRTNGREGPLEETAKRCKKNDSEQTPSRHIPAPVRDRVFARDKGRCTYVSPDGKRCGSTHHLQIDHITPFGRGGKSTEDNLRLLCGKHNRLEAERVYGANAIPRSSRRE